MSILKQSTAATIKIGPFVDDTDGKTAETALTIGQADIRLSKNGGDIAQSHNTAGATHDELGYYDIPLDTTDTGTLGRLRVLVSKAGALPVWQDFVVVTANVFDTFCSTGSLNVNAASLSTDAITAASVKADAVTKIQNGLASSSDLAVVDSNVDAILADTGTDGVVLKAAGLNADAVAEIQSGLALEATLTAIKGTGWTNETLAAIDVLIDAIKAKTDALDVSSVTVVTAVNGSTITILRGDTFSGALTNIGALTDYVSIDFTVKESYAKTDDEATIRIRKNASGTSDGLMRLNGAAASSSALGSIAVDDLASGDITITLDETATDDLSTGNYVYDIQMISASGVKTLTYGKLIVSADVTRLVA